ncbi:hypothetical protein FDA33_05955 [Clostridium botulinum]|nr:hypothetical protein [Clostridium botulinum]NFI17170.1 hypothetical protein [Clostridium botulinum]NFL92849.1 hypothetical protein [Clostridium botulinum]NFN51583.1 hypothetical protein [Clostridium botulinum]NFO27544.1 hypothetical protein [Clostridium botulinum]
MNQQYLQYAKELDKLGDKILCINQTYYKNSLDDFKDFNTTVDLFNKGAYEYSECITILKNIKPPTIVLNEHNQMILELNKFVESNNEIWKLFKISGHKDIKSTVEKLIDINKISSKNILKISTAIGDILLAN